MGPPPRRVVYRATGAHHPPGTRRVVAIDLDTREEEVLEPTERPGSWRHSPTGYGWGYLDSGPAQLAQDLLRHLSGREPTPSLYQRFKAEVLARYRLDAGWLLTGHEIEGWLRANAVALDWADAHDAERDELAGCDAWLDAIDPHGDAVGFAGEEDLPF